MSKRYQPGVAAAPDVIERNTSVCSSGDENYQREMLRRKGIKKHLIEMLKNMYTTLKRNTKWPAAKQP